MKTIYIVRHAKSSWDDISLTDHERSLSKTGVRKTKLIIDYLCQQKIIPDLMISSSAVRARETAFQIAVGIGYPLTDVVIDKALYHAGSDDVYATLFGIQDEVGSVMIFGHNPTLTYFVNNFVSPEIDNLPTTGIVSVSFSTDKWEKLTEAKFQTNFVVFPRMLKLG